MGASVGASFDPEGGSATGATRRDPAPSSCRSLRKGSRPDGGGAAVACASSTAPARGAECGPSGGWACARAAPSQSRLPDRQDNWSFIEWQSYRTPSQSASIGRKTFVKNAASPGFRGGSGSRRARQRRAPRISWAWSTDRGRQACRCLAGEGRYRAQDMIVSQKHELRVDQPRLSAEALLGWSDPSPGRFS